MSKHGNRKQRFSSMYLFYHVSVFTSLATTMLTYTTLSLNVPQCNKFKSVSDDLHPSNK